MAIKPTTLKSKLVKDKESLADSLKADGWVDVGKVIQWNEPVWMDEVTASYTANLTAALHPPNPVLNEAAKYAITANGTLTPTVPTISPQDIYGAVTKISEQTSLPPSKADDEPPPTKGESGKKISPSVAQLQKDYVKLLTHVAELTDKLEKAVGIAQAAYSMATVHEKTIAKLQNQLASHYHPPPPLQVNGTSILLPPGMPPVILG